MERIASRARAQRARSDQGARQSRVRLRSGPFSLRSIALWCLATACSSSPPAPGVGSGGSSASGGHGNTGAMTASGGSAATAGSVGSGGSAASSAAGGAVTGGATASGGATPSGGSAGTGATGGAATGGTAGVPISLPNGFGPATITAADARAAYEEFKAIHLEDCGNGVYRVRWENAKLDATVSEGIAYGMVLAVAHDEREVFDGLWAYYKLGAQENGLMNWLRYGCDAHREETYNMYPDGAATDADLDAAMALLIADCKWGGYAGDATNLINAIRAHEIEYDGDVAVLQAGDSGWYDEIDCINPSYFSPAYYRAFAQHVSAQEDKDFWNKLADDTYVLLARGSDPSSGLVRNWSSVSGGSASGCDYAFRDDYGDDAARTPWRIAMDYIWWGTPAAKAWLDKVTTWVKGQGIANIGQWYYLDGTFDTTHDGYDDHTVITVGAFACAAVSYDQPTVDEFAAEILNIPTTPGSHDAEYFPRILRALYMALLTGGYTRCGG